MCRPALGYHRSTRGDALGLDTVRFVETANIDLNE